jgi:hypothetical protein
MPYGSTYTCVQLLLLGRWRVIWVQEIGQLGKCRGLSSPTAGSSATPEQNAGVLIGQVGEPFNAAVTNLGVSDMSSSQSQSDISFLGSRSLVKQGFCLLQIAGLGSEKRVPWRQQSTGFATDRPSRSLSRQSGVDTQFRLDDHALGYRAPSWISEVGCGVSVWNASRRHSVTGESRASD